MSTLSSTCEKYLKLKVLQKEPMNVITLRYLKELKKNVIQIDRTLASNKIIKQEFHLCLLYS